MTEEYTGHTTRLPYSMDFEKDMIHRTAQIEVRLDNIEQYIRSATTDKKQVSITFITAICSTLSAIVAAGVCYIIGFGVI